MAPHIIGGLSVAASLLKKGDHHGMEGGVDRLDTAHVGIYDFLSRYLACPDDSIDNISIAEDRTFELPAEPNCRREERVAGSVQRVSVLALHPSPLSVGDSYDAGTQDDQHEEQEAVRGPERSEKLQ